MMPFCPVAAVQAALWLNDMHFTAFVVYMLPNELSDVEVNGYVCVLKKN